MKEEGILYIQDPGREMIAKLGCAAIPLIALGIGVSVEQSDRAVLIPLVLSMVLARVYMDFVNKKGFYFTAIHWSVTDDEVVIGDRTFRRSEITKVSCLPKLGLQGKEVKAWELCVETESKRASWKSQAENKAHSEESVKQFQHLAGLLDKNWSTYTRF